MLKHKRVILICSAVLFLVVLFLIKNTSVFKNTVAFVQGKQSGLTYNTVAVGDLINKDTDKDGILDWEEPFWGLNPTTAETTPGMPDSSVVAKLKAEGKSIPSEDPSLAMNEENLTETDKFSRELFSTVASLSQNGALDQATADQISNSLMEKMKNSTPRKIFTSTDIKIIKNDLYKNTIDYNNALNNAYIKNPIKGSVVDILQRFVIDENNVDTSVLLELDPIIQQTQALIENIIEIGVPESLVSLHLDFLNGTQRVLENLSDIQLYDNDVILALGGISQYESNSVLLDSALKNLSAALEKKLNN